MTKRRMLLQINNMIKVIIENPELFSDGIDVELVEIFRDIKKYINKEKVEEDE